MEESLPTTGAELMLEEEEDEEDPIDARACRMAGCREAITSPTTSLSLTCGAAWAAVAIKARRSLGLIILPVLFN